ncbi:hypothetical protein OFP26_37920, partial [Escherichia coli]|nr:hypothetical protein [Escherichia coli]
YSNSSVIQADSVFFVHEPNDFNKENVRVRVEEYNFQLIDLLGNYRMDVAGFLDFLVRLMHRTVAKV